METLNETVTVAAAGLTADDVKALRQADRVCFYFVRSEGSTIKAVKEVKKTGPFDDRTREHEFRVATAFNGKHENGDRVDVTNAHCFAMAYGWCEEWATIAAFVKVGDELRLNWYADGAGNQYTEGATVAPGKHESGAEIHPDKLTLRIQRGEKRFAFLVAVSICPANTARMIRRV